MTSDPLDILGSLKAALGDQAAQTALDITATWARAQAAVFRHSISPRPWEEEHNARAYGQIARALTRCGAAPPGPDLVELATRVWDALAAVGHTAAADSDTGDGYEVGHMPGAVLVVFKRGSVVAGLPWDATQGPVMHALAVSLCAAGYAPEPIGNPDAPSALRIRGQALRAADGGVRD